MEIKQSHKQLRHTQESQHHPSSYSVNNKRSGWPIIIIAVALCTAAAAGAFYLRTHNQPSRPSHVAPTILPGSSNHKTDTRSQYVNTKLGFSFTIPDGYRFEKEDSTTATFSGTYGEDQIIPAELIIHFNKTIDPDTLRHCDDVLWQDNVDTMCIDGNIENKTYNGIHMKLFSILKGSSNSMATSEYIIHVERPDIEFIHHVLGGGVQNRMDELLSTFEATRDADNDRNRPSISYPQPDGMVKSPLEVKGTVPTGWMFEGVFPVKLLDADRNVIAEGQAKETVPGSWQSGSPVEFSANILFSTSAQSGFIVLEKDNPSGLPENADSFAMPVRFR